jgi:hypothetical protein
MPLLLVAVGFGVLASDPGEQGQDSDRPRAAVLDDPEHQANCPTCAVQRQFCKAVGDGGVNPDGWCAPFPPKGDLEFAYGISSYAD